MGPRPEVMTWGKATPFLALSALFDAVRFMFTWFIFFGPAFAALACVAGVNSFFGFDLGGAAGKATAALCTGGAVVAGVFGVELTGAFGIIMAIVTGFTGWITVGLLLLMFNARIYKENVMPFAISLLVSAVPFVDSIPAITIALWRMYHRQIQIEKAALAKWEKENAAVQLQERNEQMMQLAQVQQAHAMQQAANDEAYALQAANDDSYGEIPSEVRKAA